MKHETNSSSGMLLGMAAGAALGAVGVMAATQNQRQLRRTTRKVMKGAENAVLQLDKMVGDFVEKHMEGYKRTPFRTERRSFLNTYFAQMHMRAVVLISPRTLRSIWMLQVTVSALLASLPVSTDAGRFLMVSTAVPLEISPETVPE